MILPRYRPITALPTRKQRVDFQQLFMNRITNYMCPPPAVRAFESKMLNGIIIDGGMGCGKTTVGEYLIKWAINQDIKLYNTDPKGIVYIYANSLPINEITDRAKKEIDFTGVEYVYIYNDDAIAGKGQHSRMSMTKENVATAQFYVNMRHKFEQCGMSDNCCLIPMHATQILTHLDRVFKCTCYMIIFKDYPNDKYEQDEIRDQIGLEACNLLRRITQTRKFSPDPMQRIKALSTFVVKTVDPYFPVILVSPSPDDDPMKYKNIACPVEPYKFYPDEND